MDLSAHLAREFSALADAPRWWVALSGGVDSVVLLHLAAQWSQTHDGPPVAAIHINHGISPQAGDWEAQCAAHCGALDVPLTVVVIDPLDPDASGLEQAARDARYAAFAQWLEAEELLLQGHHQDDLAETVLFRLLRGAGARGLAAIPHERPLGEGSVVRPMLGVPRAAITQWADEQGLTYIQDPANEDLRFDRNYLRHQVLPVIEARWPGYRQTLARSATLQRALVEDSELDDTLLGVNGCNEPTLEFRDANSDSAVASRLHRWLSELGVLPPDRARLDEFARQVRTAAPDRVPHLPLGDIHLHRWRDQIHVSINATTFDDADTVCTVGTALAGAWGQIHWVPAEQGLPLGLALSLRQRHAGESIAPLGRPGRSLSQWWQECGVPPWWRDSIPLFCDETDAAVFVPGCGLTSAAISLISEEKPLWRAVWRPPRTLSELSQ